MPLTIERASAQHAPAGVARIHHAGFTDGLFTRSVHQDKGAQP
jgi:hypothetical protein